METIDKLYGKIQKVGNQLVSTPDSRTNLEALQTSLRADWGEYRSAVADYREHADDDDDITALDNQVTHATKLFNITDQGITNKLTKLIEDEIKEERRAKDVKPSLPTISEEPPVDQGTQTTQADPPKGLKEPAATEQTAEDKVLDAQIAGLKQPDTLAAQALAALLKQITGQFNDIIAGKYPKREDTAVEETSAKTAMNVVIGINEQATCSSTDDTIKQHRTTFQTSPTKEKMDRPYLKRHQKR